MPSKELLPSTAYHEAGHTVVAFECETLADYVEVHFNEEFERWEGVTALPELEGETNEKLINSFAICFGGLFSQAKHRVNQICPDEEVPYTELLNWVFKGLAQPFEMLLKCGEELLIPTWWFQGGDCDQFQYLSAEAIETLGEHDYLVVIQKAVLQKTIPILDREWDRVESLAAALIASVDGSEGRIPSEQLSSLLS